MTFFIFFLEPRVPISYPYETDAGSMKMPTRAEVTTVCRTLYAEIHSFTHVYL